MKGKKQFLTIIIPCYKSENTIITVVHEIINTIPYNNYEIILINDNSPDNVWKKIKILCKKYSNIHALSLSKNFGQHAARMAALPYVNSEYIIFMDDDGQHPASGIKLLVDKLEEGYDIVYAHFKNKKISWLKKQGSNFNKIMADFFVGKPKDIIPSSFWGVKSFVIDALKEYRSPFPYLLGYLMNITHNIANVEMDHRNRIAGKSNYNFVKMITLWFNGFIGFSVIPLRLTSILGTVSSGMGLILGIIYIIKKILNPDIILGYTSTIVVILFLGGIVLLMLGLIGEYIGRILITVNKIPQYVIRDKINL